MEQANKLSPADQERIKADAERYAGLMVWVNQDPEGNLPLFHEYISSTSYIAGATAENNNATPMYDTLIELLALKEHKGKHGKTPEYLKRQPIAWQRVKEALQQWKQGKEVGYGK